jgi:hypothetical protein
MASPPREVTIDGARYLIGRLPPRRALKLGNRIVKAAGPGLVALVASGEGKLGDLDLGALGSVIRSVFDALSPEEQDAIMAELFEPVVVLNIENGKSAPVMVVFDAHFADRLPAALKLMWECLQDNFSSFGDALAGLAGKTAGAPRSVASTGS